MFAYRPRLLGHYRVWISWGCGWLRAATTCDASLDPDGDPATADDQREIARRRPADVRRRHRRAVRKQADVERLPRCGPPPVPARLARLLIVADGTGDPVTADAVLFEEAASPETAERVTPHLRVPGRPGRERRTLSAVTARFVRFRIQETTDAEPCLDELEVFTAEPGPRNAAARVGRR